MSSGPRHAGVVPLLNAIVDVCLVYGLDETCSRELEIKEEGDMQTSLMPLLQRDIKLHFLQLVAPGQVYPERPASPPSQSCSPTASLAPDPTPEGSGGVKHSKLFNVEELGLTWETVETVHWFMFPEGPRMSEKDVDPSLLPMLLTNIDGARTYATGLRFTRPFFVQKQTGGHYYKFIPWKPSMKPPPNSQLLFLPTCCVLLSKRPYFQFMRDALSGFHDRACGDDGDEMDFWELLRLYMERLFLIPSPPPGSLAVEYQLPQFSSQLLIRPPRGDQYVDIRLNYPFLCLSVDNILQVMSALLTEQRLIFFSSLYPMLTYVIQCFLSYISPFDWRQPCVPILPLQLVEYLEAPGTNIMGCHSAVAEADEFKQVDDAVIVYLDSDTVECRLVEPSSLPQLPQQAVAIFKQRYDVWRKTHFEIQQIQRLAHLAVDDLQNEREEFERQQDDHLARMFLELMVNIYDEVTSLLLQSRLKYEEFVKKKSLQDQEFYRYTSCTDMFSAFYQGRRLRTQRDEFTLLAEWLRRQQRKAGLEDDMTTSLTMTLPCISPSSPKLSSNYSRATVSSTFRSYLAPDPAPTSTSFNISGSSAVSQEDSQRLSLLAASCPGYSLELVRLELPSLTEESIDRGLFMDSVIALLNDLMQNRQVQAQCIYLKAFYCICQGRFVEALDAFYDTLQRLDVQLVPAAQTMRSVVSFLSPEEKECFQSKSYHKLISPRKKVVRSGPIRKHFSSTYNLVSLEKKMPKNPLSINEFLRIVSENAIVSDADSAGSLYRILAQGTTSNVEPAVFATFYECWKGVIQDNDSVDLPGVEMEHGDKASSPVQEKVLAVSSNTLRTNYGSQCMIVLTTYRLLAIANFVTYIMADIRKQYRFEKTDIPLGILGSKSPAIGVERMDKVKKKEDSKDLGSVGRLTLGRRRAAVNNVYIGFQNATERENWYRMMIEVKVGWTISQARKDPSILETAECHIILQNAVNQSGLLEQYRLSHRTKLSLKLLSFQAKDISEVSQFTVEALQYRINPCLHETEKQTVESLLYIPPSDGGQGRLWIGLGNGRLKVYDMEAKCFESDIKITESRYGKSVRLSCLLLVGRHVWVGSFSRTVHILDAETVCYVSQLPYLEDAPRDLALSQSEPQLVWSLLLNGVLMAWEPETRTRVTRLQVPVMEESPGLQSSSGWLTYMCFTIWRDHVWVGTNRGTLTVLDSRDGMCVKHIAFPSGGKRQVEIRHLALSNEDEVWCSVSTIPRGKDSTFISVFDPRTHENKLKYTELDNRISIILQVNNTMWCGSKSGKIYIFDAKTYANRKGMPKVLSAHDDSIRAMTMTDIGIVVSGSGSNDGYAAVWKAIVN